MGSSRLLLFTGFAILGGLSLGLAGCAPTPPPAPSAPAGPTPFEAGKPPYLIPANAVRVAEGPPPLSYIPSAAATVYILDDNTLSLVNTSEVPANVSGSFFVIDGTEKAVLVKSASEPSQRLVLAAPIDVSHRFSIWVIRQNSATQP